MSFKLSRRDSEEPTDANNMPADSETEKKPQKQYSVTAYVCLLFAVVIIVVLMSYFVQQRNNSAALLSLRQQHDQVTSQAFENIEKLQDQNMELLDENNGLKEKLSELESEIKTLRDEAETAKTEAESVKTENKAMKDLSALQTAILNKNTDKAKTLITKISGETDILSQEGKDNFNALKNAYDELKGQLEIENTEE